MDPLDIWYVIFNNCDLLSQVMLISTCSVFNRNLFVTNMWNAPANRKRLILIPSDLEQRKFIRIKELDIRYSCEIRDVSFLTNLKKLRIHSKIKQCGIQGLDLIELIFDPNQKIKDVSFMTNLKKLYAGEFCEVNQFGIKGLDLVELNIWENHRIHDVSFMTNLKKLDISGQSCGVGRDGIKSLDLIELNIDNNAQIRDISFMTNLKKLSAGEYCGIDQQNIQRLDLIELASYIV